MFCILKKSLDILFYNAIYTAWDGVNVILQSLFPRKFRSWEVTTLYPPRPKCSLLCKDLNMKSNPILQIKVIQTQLFFSYVFLRKLRHNSYFLEYTDADTIRYYLHIIYLFIKFQKQSRTNYYYSLYVHIGIQIPLTNFQEHRVLNRGEIYKNTITQKQPKESENKQQKKRTKIKIPNKLGY